MAAAWINKYELARLLGLLNRKGEPQVYSINTKCASGEWDSHLVHGQLRFSPEDVAAIEEKLRHPAVTRRKQATPAEPEPPNPRPKKAKPARQSNSTNGQPAGALIDLEDRPIRTRPPRTR